MDSDTDYPGANKWYLAAKADENSLFDLVFFQLNQVFLYISRTIMEKKYI